jgi:hypothetical protein
MQVVEEAITVLREGEEPGVTLVMGGYRIALSTEEARRLVGSLAAALSGAAPPEREGAAIAARVREQMISWAQIAQQVERN